MTTPESRALTELVDAAAGKAPREAISILGSGILGPWCGNREAIVNGSTRAVVSPGRQAPSSATELFSFLGAVQDRLAAPLPHDTGVLAYLRHRNLACAVQDLGRGPGWLYDELLEGAWLALPPVDRYTGADDGDLIAHDGRMTALHMLLTSIQGPVPQAAALVIAQWCVGVFAADWSEMAASQCPAMAWFGWARPRSRGWITSRRHLDAADVVSRLSGPPIIGPDWVKPPPTKMELLLAAEAEQLAETQRVAAVEQAARKEAARLVRASRA